MQTARYVYWQEGDFWLGYFEDYPDCMTQAGAWRICRSNCVISGATWGAVKYPAFGGLLNSWWNEGLVLENVGPR